MEKHTWWIVTLALVLASVTGQAQTVVNPRTVEFDPSADHAVLAPDGQPMVARYDLQFFLYGASAPFQTADLGKPSPNGTGKIVVDFSTTLVAWPLPNGDYVARVAAVGPTGSGQSAPSNLFTFLNCTTAISPTTATLPAAGGTATVTVTASTGCLWTATSEVSWITIAPTSGTGGVTVTVTVQANTAAASRTGSVTIAGQTLTVTQAGTPVCSYSILPTSVSPAASGGSTTVTVTTTSGCAWNATGNGSWITVNPASGTGNATVTVTVQANLTTSPRTGTATIAGQAFTVNQAGTTCSYSILPTSVSPAASGGSTTVTVTTTSGCAWNATGNGSWITVNPASGTGNATVTVTVQANPTTSPRTGTATIAGQTFTVNQAGVPCSHSISPVIASLPAAGGNATVTVTATSGCTWNATGNESWITLNTASGTGNGTVTVTVQANPTTSPRAGTATIAGQTFTVNQAGTTCSYSILPTSASVAAGGGATAVSLTASAGCTWSTTSDAAWLSLAPTTGNGDATVSVIAQPNTTTTARTGTVRIAGQTFTVTQAAAVPCAFSLSPPSQSFSSSGGTGSVTLTVTAGTGCSWTAGTQSSWITIGTPSGTGNGVVTYAVGANVAGATRTGALTIAGQTFTVTQAGVGCSYAISPASAPVAAAGGTTAVSVTAAVGCSWSTTSNVSWITPDPDAGVGDGQVSLTVDPNPTTTARSGTVTIGGQTFTVSQSGASCTYSISPTAETSPAAGGSIPVGVTSPTGCNWTARSNVSWISLSTLNGTGTMSVTLTVSANAAADRMGTVTIAGQTFTVTQTGINCSFAISPDNASVAASGDSVLVSVTSPNGCNWSVRSNVSWVTPSAVNGTGSTTVTLTVATNTTTSGRTGTVTMAGQTFTVTQAGGTCTFNLSPTSASISARGGNGSFTVTTGSGCPWTLAGGAPWVTARPTSGAGSRTVSFTVQINSTVDPRSATLTVGGKTFTVNQVAPSRPLPPGRLRKVTGED